MLQLNTVDGASSSTINGSTVGALSQTGVRLPLDPQHIQFSDGNTRKFSISLAYESAGNGIVTSSDLGGIPAIIQVTKLS